MSSANVRRFDIDAMAERAMWFDRSQLDAMFRNEVTPGRGVNRDERADIRDRIRKRIAELRKAARRSTQKPKQAPSRHYPDIPPVPPFNQAQLRRAVEEIETEVRRHNNVRSKGDPFPWSCEFGQAALWLLDQLGKPSCLLAIQCSPNAAVCARCEWLFTLYSKAGRESLRGGMLGLQQSLGLISVGITGETK